MLYNGSVAIVHWQQHNIENPHAGGQFAMDVYVGYDDVYYASPPPGAPLPPEGWRRYWIPNRAGAEVLRKPRTHSVMDHRSGSATEGLPFIVVGLDDGGNRDCHDDPPPEDLEDCIDAEFSGHIDLLVPFSDEGAVAWRRELVPFGTDRTDYPSILLAEQGLIVTATQYDGALHQPQVGRPLADLVLVRQDAAGNWKPAQSVLQTLYYDYDYTERKGAGRANNAPFALDVYSRFIPRYPSMAPVDADTSRMNLCFGQYETSNGALENYLYILDYDTSAARFVSNQDLPLSHRCLVEKYVGTRATDDIPYSALSPDGAYLMYMREGHDPEQLWWEFNPDTLIVRKLIGSSWEAMPRSIHPAMYSPSPPYLDYHYRSNLQYWLSSTVTAISGAEPLGQDDNYCYLTPFLSTLFSRVGDETGGATLSYVNTGYEPPPGSCWCTEYRCCPWTIWSNYDVGVNGGPVFESSQVTDAFGGTNEVVVARHLSDGEFGSVVVCPQGDPMPETTGFGDFDFDGDFDADDWNIFQQAQRGSGVPAPNLLCDYDGDMDVDDVDEAALP